MIPCRVFLCVPMCESKEEQRAGVSCYLLPIFILSEKPGLSLLVCFGAILGAKFGISILTLLFQSPLRFTEVSLSFSTQSLNLFFLMPVCLSFFPFLLDSSQEYTDSTGIDVHEFLVNTLKNNPRYEITIKGSIIFTAIIGTEY